MPRRELQEWLISNSGFLKRYRRIVQDNVVRQFSTLQRGAEGSIQPDWPYLLLCGSLLADSESGECQDIALRIAQSCLADAATTTEEKESAAIVLDELGNRLAISLCETRKILRPRLAARLGVAGRLEWTRRSIDNSVDLTDGSVLSTNRFQHRFWNDIEQTDWMSISAPTSAGKSFITVQWIVDFFKREPQGTVVYLVPTRALIHQVESDFRSLRRERSIANVAVATIPMKAAFREAGGNFLVFTQERFHLFLSAFEELPAIDVIIVDEAHKVGDRQRGVLLQDVIERVVAKRPKVKIIFASPQTENPEVLLEDATSGLRTKAVVSNDVTVNQNLLWATQAPGNPRRWNISLCRAEGTEGLGTVEVAFIPTSVSKRLPFVAHSLTPPEGGSVIYVDGAADAEKAAELLFDLEGRDADPIHLTALKELAELAQAAIHDDYSLARVLSRGIAFHYGNMPLIVRNEIERCFRDGHIKFLVCTSTLIEGVNLPCKSIFVRGPKKGRNQPMNEGDFWNLAGRAGRWGREFQGNVVCVDTSNPNVWKLGVPQVRRRYRIERTTDRVMKDPSRLVEFIRNGTPREEFRNNQELEYMASYLVATMLRAGSISASPVGRHLSPSVLQDLEGTLRPVIETLTIAPQIIWRNPGISPIAMERLKKYFATREGKPEELVPVPPSSDDAASHYIAILNRINRELAPVFGIGPRAIMLGLLITSWMRGYPLKRLITERINYLTRRPAPVNVPAVIRAVMSDVEEVARFQAPKYLSCYIDVLREYLQSIDRVDLLPADLDVNVLLEFGVPGGTQLSLMGLGLSRISALALAEIIAADALTEPECLVWLRNNAWEQRDLPELVKREIRFALQVN
jgi:hypothetical protein